ncbi:MAG: DUF4929 family protein [Prevotella sp.]|nr:DUF4929 family protein [Prevotella sp.]
MKKMMMALLGLLSLTFVACGDDETDKTPQIKNYVELSKESKTLYDNDTEGVELTLTLAYAPEQDVTFGLALDGDAAGAFELSPNTVTIAKGSKTATAKLRATGAILAENEALTVKIASCTDDNIRTDATLAVLGQPAVQVADLTADQLKLVATWIEKYGVDVRPLLGMLDVETVVTFNTEDKDYYNNGEETKTLKGQTAFTLSDKATEDHIVLKMTSNPMGVQEFFYEMLMAQSTKDEEYWVYSPYNLPMLDAINYNEETETFSMELDELELDPATMTFSFTKPYADDYTEWDACIDYTYHYTAWERLQQAAAEGKTILVDNGDAGTEEVALSDAIETGATLNPFYYLTLSDISADQWGSEPSLFVEPSSSLSLADGKLTFRFAWDFLLSSGYQQINVTYALNK